MPSPPTARSRIKWLCFFINANPRFAILYIIHRILPKRIRYDVLYRRTGSLHSYMISKTARIYTDFFHSVSFVDISLGFPYELLGFDLKKGMKIVDVGAHHGIYSIKATMNGASGVVAIEPHPTNFKALKRNIAENRATSIIAVNAAVSDKDGNTLLFESPFSGQHSILPFLPAVFHGKATQIPSYTLDTLLSQLQFDPDLLKIDCEGAELLVLQGAKKLLTQPRDRKVIVEVHSHGGRDVETCLAGFGFETRTLFYHKPCVFAEKTGWRKS